MSISHHHILVPGTDEAVVFAELFGFTCSICAPTSWTVGQVIEFAEKSFPTTDVGLARWVSIDKSELGMGSPTPNPCNQYPEERMHWFMMRGDT